MKKTRIISWVLITAITFAIGFSIGLGVFGRQMTEREFKYCEDVAKEIYKQKDNFLFEVPENITFTKSDTEITVQFKQKAGKVVANLKDGELVTTRYKLTGKDILINILSGLLLVCILIIFVLTEANCNKKIVDAKEYSS